MQTFDGKSGIIFDSMNEEWKWNPSGEIGKDFIRTNVTDCQGKVRLNASSMLVTNVGHGRLSTKNASRRSKNITKI